MSSKVTKVALTKINNHQNSKQVYNFTDRTKVIVAITKTSRIKQTVFRL